jgi:hypothetical protein
LFVQAPALCRVKEHNNMTKAVWIIGALLVGSLVGVAIAGKVAQNSTT